MKITQCFEWVRTKAKYLTKESTLKNFLDKYGKIINFLAIILMVLISGKLFLFYYNATAEQHLTIMNYGLVIVFGLATMCFAWASSLNAEINDDNIEDKCKYRKMQKTMNFCGRRYVQISALLIVASILNYTRLNPQNDYLSGIDFINNLSGAIAFLLFLTAWSLFWRCLKAIIDLSYDKYGNEF